MIEKLYQNYLLKVKLKESDMGTVQRIQTKQAFFAGITFYIMSILQAPELPEPLEDIASEIHAEQMVKELSVFWKTQNGEDLKGFGFSQN